MRRFEGKAVLILGGNAGIGAAAAQLFANEGARLVITGRNETTLGDIAAQTGAHAIRADMGVLTESRDAITAAADHLGGIDHRTAADGEQALVVAAREHPHLMILDLKLPDIDGMEVCRRLKADPRTASIAVLQTSAEYATTEAKVHGLDGGADALGEHERIGEDEIEIVIMVDRQRRIVRARQARGFAAR